MLQFIHNSDNGSNSTSCICVDFFLYLAGCVIWANLYITRSDFYVVRADLPLVLNTIELLSYMAVELLSFALQEVKIHGTKLRNMTFVHFAKMFLS